ncbi:unnamed protein product [Blepharisma stoltei]|uniref:Uncharacterized protein n=1 Tax=Blepharisma stoltei TaxID=1481888 RepID=A0AAU9IFD1_9CILI|nr:unnamed protein product [Blepharisma stoltei]
MTEQRWNERLGEMMKKQRNTQEKLKMLKTQKILDEMKEVTGVPKINEVSRKVAAELERIEAEKKISSDSHGRESTPPPQTPKNNTKSQLSKSLARDFMRLNKDDDPESKRLPPPTDIIFPPKKFENVPSKNFKDLQEAYVRAQTLHCQQQDPQPLSPRCHVNLPSGQASEPYINLRAPANGKVINKMGVSQAETLRRDFLTTEEKKKESLDTYKKNIQWAQKLEDKLNEQRWDKQVSEIASCTFKPAVNKTQNLRNSFSGNNEGKGKSYTQIHDQRKTMQASLENQEAQLKKATSVKNIEGSIDDLGESQNPFTNNKPFTYSSLTPMGAKVKYREGFNVKKFMNTAKPMVSYQQLG